MTLPRELEALGYTEGTEVVISTLENGALMVMTAAQVDGYLDALMDRIVAENRGALDRLVAYDRGQRLTDGDTPAATIGGGAAGQDR